LDTLGVVRSITGRVKSRESITNKLRRPDKRYARLTDMTDLVGARVITMLADDVRAVVEVLEDAFDVDGENCWDMSWTLGTEDFGYRSVHYIVSPRAAGVSREDEWGRELKCEVQVRSLLQDAWAQIAHDFSYKSLLSVPETAHRRMSLAAGLLETADREFGELRDAVASYRTGIEAAQDAPEDSIGRAAVARVLSSDEDVFGVDRSIAADVESALLAAPTGYLDHYVKMLTCAGFRNISEAVARLVADSACVRAFGAAVARRRKRPRIMYRGISLFYLCYFVSATDVATLTSYMECSGVGSATWRRANLPDILRIAAEVAVPAERSSTASGVNE